MQIVSWNINGIKNIAREGFPEWLKKTSPDILCLQETHFGQDELSNDLRMQWPYRSYWDYEKENFSGVAVYTKLNLVPKKVHHTVGLPWFDKEGKIIVLEYDRFSIVNVRMPHGWRGKGTLEEKVAALKEFLGYAEYLKDKPVIICGGFNVAQKSIDVTKPKEHDWRATFTNIERVFMKKLVSMGFVDTFRMFSPNEINYTSWKSEEHRERNVGHRIDCIFVSRSLVPHVKKGFIATHTHGSDHCPVVVELNDILVSKTSSNYLQARQ